MIVSLEPELLERLSRLDGAANTTVAEELDTDLAAAVRRTAVMRRLFYAAVLAVALYGTATTVTVTVRGTAVSIIPGFRPPVTVTVEAPVERIN